MRRRRSITIMVPAYNEEKYLKDAITSLKKVLAGIDYEMLIFDDGSTDDTGKIADALADSRIRAIHNSRNMGLGYNYRSAIKLSKKEYFGWVPGDNDMPIASIKDVISNIGLADIIVPFTINMEVRPLHRRILSRSYTNLINLLFGLDLKYYNGIAVFETKHLKKIKLKTNSFSLQTEALVKLIMAGCSYREIPVTVRGVEESKIFRPRNIMGMFSSILALFFDVSLRRKHD